MFRICFRKCPNLFEDFRSCSDVFGICFQRILEEFKEIILSKVDVATEFPLTEALTLRVLRMCTYRPIRSFPSRGRAIKHTSNEIERFDKSMMNGCYLVVVDQYQHQTVRPDPSRRN